MQTAEVVVGSLVKQVAISSDILVEDLKNAYYQHSVGAPRPDLEQLMTILLRYHQNFPSACVIFDGIDECLKSWQGKFMRIVQSMLDAGIKVVITTRDDLYESMKMRFRLACTIKVQAQVHDIELYITEQLRNLVDPIDDHAQRRIAETISRNARGMSILLIEI